MPLAVMMPLAQKELRVSKDRRELGRDYTFAYSLYREPFHLTNYKEV